MFKKLVSVAVLLISTLFFSCTEDQSTNPVQLAENGNHTGGLAKRIWNTSSVYNWSTYTYYDDLYRKYFTQSYPTYSFTFDNYNYSLEYSRTGSGTYTNKVTIKVNNTYCSEITWNNTDGTQNSRWLGWHSFSYNGTSMQIDLYVVEHYIPMEDWSEPRQVIVQVYDIVAPDAPTGFSVSPGAHNNLNQAVTISWDVSADTDVTGYKIYRSLQTSPSTWTLVQTVNSRTTSSWIDTTVPWSLSNPEMTVVNYKMVAYDGTHNLTSAYTVTRDSSMP